MQVNVGIAIGAGADIAIESADVIIVSDKLSRVLDAYHIGRKSAPRDHGSSSSCLGHVAVGFSVATVLLNSFGGRRPKHRTRCSKT